MKRKYKITIVDKYKSDKKIFNLVNIELPPLSSKVRSKIIYDIMEIENYEGIIELWFNTGIIDKPKEKLLAITMSKIPVA